MSPSDVAAHRIRDVIVELDLGVNDAWLAVVQCCASVAVGCGMTLEETLHRVAKAYAFMEKEYAKAEAEGES